MPSFEVVHFEAHLSCFYSTSPLAYYLLLVTYPVYRIHSLRPSYNDGLLQPRCNSNMYGLGIRRGFYSQRYSSTPAHPEIEGLCFTNSLFVAPTFLALIVPTANGVPSLQPANIYVMLALTFGYYQSLIPLYAWRIMTSGRVSLGPTRWPVVPPTVLYNVLSSLSASRH
jgi:hypothetical protein